MGQGLTPERAGNCTGTARPRRQHALEALDHLCPGNRTGTARPGRGPASSAGRAWGRGWNRAPRARPRAKPCYVSNLIQIYRVVPHFPQGKPQLAERQLGPLLRDFQIGYSHSRVFWHAPRKRWLTAQISVASARRSGTARAAVWPLKFKKSLNGEQNPDLPSRPTKFEARPLLARRQQGFLLSVSQICSPFRRILKLGSPKPRPYSDFLPSLALMRPAMVGMTLTRTMPTMSSSKCSCTKGMPPKK